MAAALSAVPLDQPLILYQGDDWRLDIVVTNPDGTPADLTGATVSSQVRRTPDAAEVLGEFTATIEGNTIHLHMPASTSATITSGVWDCQLATPDVVTLVGGKLTVPLEVTRA